ncbi:M48 family metallopeptidase [Helicobacter saguini]|uniref:M48 family metallopeptidase n=1 Tax=Helicobacter saguini TaxID=1548018 RepID=UPI001EE7DD69|nr:M48 family metallopeptidase [Helicobacter saguini]
MENVQIVLLAYLVCFCVPSIIIDILQIKYVSFYASKKPIILDSNDYKLAANYAILQRKVSIATHIFEFIMLIFWLYFGINYLDRFYEHTTFSPLAKEWCIVMSFFAISAGLNLPFSILQKRIDRVYGFHKGSATLFIKDIIKSIVLVGALGGILLGSLLWIMDNVPQWWIFGFVLFFTFIIVIQLIYPTIIAPLFNKFSPLQNANLESRINALMDKVGFKSSGVFVMDASKRDGRLNAYFGGLGRSKRVVLFDTLLEKISEDGLIAILGHELGHFKHKDILRNIIIAGAILLGMFAFMGLFTTHLCTFLGLSVSYSNIIILSILLMPALTFLVQPLSNYFSRKAEYKADSFGASCVSQKALREALIRLVNENKAFPYSHPAYIFFYYSHPPLIERLKALGVQDSIESFELDSNMDIESNLQNTLNKGTL